MYKNLWFSRRQVTKNLIEPEEDISFLLKIREKPIPAVDKERLITDLECLVDNFSQPNQVAFCFNALQ